MRSVEKSVGAKTQLAAGRVGAGLQSQEPGLYLPLALDFDSAARLEGELALELLVDRARHLNGVGIPPDSIRLARFTVSPHKS